MVEFIHTIKKNTNWYRSISHNLVFVFLVSLVTKILTYGKKTDSNPKYNPNQNLTLIFNPPLGAMC